MTSPTSPCYMGNVPLTKIRVKSPELFTCLAMNETAEAISLLESLPESPLVEVTDFHELLCACRRKINSDGRAKTSTPTAYSSFFYPLFWLRKITRSNSSSTPARFGISVLDHLGNYAAPYVRDALLRMLENNTQHGTIEIYLNDPNSSRKAKTVTFGDRDNQQSDQLKAMVVVNDNPSLWLKLCQNLDIGVAEAYMLQSIECSDLVSLFRIYIRNWASLGTVNSMVQQPLRLWNQVTKRINDTENALQNASFHYDTSNELFKAFLSKDMCYSCPIWKSLDEPLEAAQRRKAHNIIEKADIRSTDHVLDIGGGWGFIAMEAVRLTGCRVTVVTLSIEQKSLGEELIKAQSCENEIHYRLCDYRKIQRPEDGFDRIISVEMIEAVGKEYIDEFFRTLHNLLNPTDGRIVIQSITFMEKLHSQPKTLDNFLDKYIFPGGYLPCNTELVNSLSRSSEQTLELDSLEEIGENYVKALRLWKGSFVSNWPSIKASFLHEHGLRPEAEMEAFRRRWIYYFSYCQAGFHEGILGDVILAASRRPRVMSNSPILKSVAIVGSGAAGVAALWALHNHSPHMVDIYEADNRLGGHSNTVAFRKGKDTIYVDTGFIVLNTATYPNFISFLKAINIPTEKSEMTFSVSRDWGRFEWAGNSLASVFAQRSNLFSWQMWRMLFDILRFNLFALDLLRDEQTSPIDNLSVGQYLDDEGYSPHFRDNYLIPMTAAIWSTSPDKCFSDFPVITLVLFMWNHHLIDTFSVRPPWLTLKNKARSYIDAVLADIPSDRVHLNTPIRSVTNDLSGQVLLTTEQGVKKKYDHAIVATHAPEALSLISHSATNKEREILSEFETSQNTAVLHSDTAFMPQNRKTWSAWNYQTTKDSTQPSLTYNSNILQGIPTSKYGDVLVTLNPLRSPAPATVQGTYSYAHPLLTAGAMKAQSLLSGIQGTRGISYAGGWTKFGFHEDAFTSGSKVAVEQLGAKLPFKLVDSELSRGKVPELTRSMVLLRLCFQVLHFALTWVVWILEILASRDIQIGKRVKTH
ncbi:amine oxidase [Aspergillus affinis]|uniref:amine oxidase n=1 Tax=Aspergillus affinis TaxID=1070780 RepID=UPI0022FDD0C3|nr:amine oxidase [Aspergillus affinis]KAI9036614.1 amine oxidase [Aspergillus affinis]